MSEFEPKLEASKQHEKLVDNEHHKHAEELIHEKAEQARQQRSAENLKLLHEMAAKQAETRDKTLIEQPEESETDSLLGMQQSLKTNAYAHTLRRIQQRLPKQARLFSKISHNKTVETISDIGSTTVARPSGLLGGSILAFIGNLTLLYYSKHYGFRYNYALFVILFIGGFLVGSIIEVVVRTLYRRKHGHY
jgi:hypothetical protein